MTCTIPRLMSLLNMTGMMIPRWSQMIPRWSHRYLTSPGIAQMVPGVSDVVRAQLEG